MNGMMQTLPAWDDVRIFLAAAEAESLSAAARTLGIGQATMSRRIAQLEESVGYPLFRRSVEGIALTASGAGLLSAARTMHDGALAFEAAARGEANELFGRVRFAASPGVAVDVLTPFAAALRQVHPHIRLELITGIGHVDLTRGEADIAMRTNEPREPALVAVGAAIVRLAVYAAASYRATLTEPCALEDLEWVGWAPPFEGIAPESWLRSQIADFRPVFTADTYVALERAAVAGLGAILLPEMQAELLGGVERVRLKPALAKKLPRARIYVVAARSTLRSPRVAAVAEHLLDWLEAVAGEPVERRA